MNALLAGLMAWQGLVWCGESADRQTKYLAALAYARSVDKPLLVVGGPQGSPFRALTGTQMHGYGDVCADLDTRACAGAPSGCEVVSADVRNLAMYPAGRFGAAFASHILEHLPTVADAQQAYSELCRVADVVLVAAPSAWALYSTVHPGHRLFIRQEPDGSLTIAQRF